MRLQPTAMMYLHLATTAAAWLACLAVGLLFGAHVGVAVFVATEARAIIAVVVRAQRDQGKGMMP